MDTSANPASIAEEELPGGAVRLRRGDRVAAGQREAARVITMAWGDRYIADLLSLTIPALLAPGNMPAFVRHFDAEFVIVTETRLFGLISRAPAIFQLLRLCEVRLVPVDDLLSNWYGITLTYALVRGFVDLGEAMVGAHLVFLNADFIVADGSYAKLAEAILRGERLVVSPSYCMVLEDTIGQLRARYDGATHSVAVPPRELAAMILAHRHNTVRAKTVNQQLFRIHRYDQFYWYVDDRTMLCRQMPIAVIYMRPERMLTEMPTFWDYGVIREYCPNAVPCVLGDSDDFLMAELRTEGTFAELLHIGWPEVGEIAEDLSSFTTQDHHDYGRHTLTLHSGDLPAVLEAGKAGLAAFVDQVYARLAPPISHLNHPFWAPAFPRFLARQIDQRQRRAQREAALGELLRREPRAGARQQRMAQLRGRLREVGAAQLAIAEKAADRRLEADGELAALERDYQLRRQAVEEGLAARTAPLEREGVAVATQIGELERELSGLAAEQEREVDVLCGLTGPVAADAASEAALRAAAAPTSAGLARWYYRVFGQLPDTTRWHPYHTVVRPARAAIVAGGAVADTLLISSGGSLGPLLVKGVSRSTLSITPRMASAGLYSGVIGQQRKFDLCVFDLAFDDLFELRGLIGQIRPLLAERGRVVVFHHNRASRALDHSTYQFTRSTFPLAGRSRVSFAGSWPGAIAATLFDRALNRPSSRWYMPVLGMILGICAPFAGLATWIEARRPRRRLPRRCTSMTIEIDFD